MARATFPVHNLRQRASRLPYQRYAPGATVDLPDRSWPGRRATSAPRWLSTDLRDGNQALPHPMDVERKSRLFRLLVDIGYKEIEVGFPAASRTDFDFTRKLIENDEIPDDVLIQVIVPAREELIRRTFDAIAGAKQAIVHLYTSTSPTQRRVVFRTDRTGMRQLAADHTRLCRELADAHPGRIGFEYSAESFSQTELDFALDICTDVIEVWEPARDREIILNLPATVECAGPHVFADQVEWMSRNLPRREHVCLSLHPHNDRGTGIAAAELGLLAGGQRVEGCLFGNGERTGNVCLAVLALNLMSHGIDPQIDLSDIDAVRHEVEQCTGMPVPERHPYVGDLVHTSFSGSHQDAISKGLQALAGQAQAQGVPVRQVRWDVPYLPIDPKDIGRSYQGIIRLNSQSGKGGVDFLLRSRYGLRLPRNLQIEMSGLTQAMSDEDGREVTAEELWAVFRSQFLPAAVDVHLTAYDVSVDPSGPAAVKVELAARGGSVVVDTDLGGNLLPGVARALGRSGAAPVILDHIEQQFTLDGQPGTLAYVRCRIGGLAVWGCGFDPDPAVAALRGLCVALHRAGWVPGGTPPRNQL